MPDTVVSGQKESQACQPENHSKLDLRQRKVLLLYGNPIYLLSVGLITSTNTFPHLLPQKEARRKNNSWDWPIGTA